MELVTFTEPTVVEEVMIEEFDPALMMAIVDHFTVHEDGRLQIRYHDGTEFEVATE